HNDGLAEREPLGVGGADRERGQGSETGLDRKQRAFETRFALLVAQRGKRLQAHRVLLVERPYADASERRHMAEAAERAAKVARDGAHVSALAALGLEGGVIGVGRLDQIEAMDFDFTRGEYDRLALTGQIVGALAG